MEIARDVLEADQLHPTALILQGIHHLNEVPIAGDQQHLVQFVGLEHGVHRHIQVGVGLGGDIAGLVGVATHQLDRDLPAEIPHHLLIGASLLGVLCVLASTFGIKGHIGIQALQGPFLAGGEAAQYVITHLVSAVVADILGVHKDANTLA